MKYLKTISVTKHYDIKASSKRALKAAIKRATEDTGAHGCMMFECYEITLSKSPPAPPSQRWVKLKNDDIIQSTDLAFSNDNPGSLKFVTDWEVGSKAGSFNRSGFCRLVTNNQD